MARLNIPRWMVILQVLAFSITTAISQTITPTSETSANADDDLPYLDFLLPNNTQIAPNVLPLTQAAQQDDQYNLPGTAFFADAATQLNISAWNIALISCDPDAYPGNIDAIDVLGQAESQGAVAVVFYSETEKRCELEGYQDDYKPIFSSRGDVDEVKDWLDLLRGLGGLNGNSRDGASMRITTRPNFSDGTDLIGNDDDDDDNNGGRGSGRPFGVNNDDDDDDGGGFGSSPSTTVAMIILYSITGIITALFLAIVLTGAVRAHRHPERYGPRNVFGRPRQSRARGLARAMLDSLPIVKVGEHPEQQKEGDVELAENNNSDQPSTAATNTTSAPTATSDAPDASPATRTNSVDNSPSGIAAAKTTPNDPNNGEQGCSICTDDFQTGQDQRVLPCNHRFHPECVDPWLLNVSGTCPLCRIDLRPAEAVDEVDENGNPVRRASQVDGDMPPPLGREEQPVPRMGIRRSLAAGFMGMSRLDHDSAEQRIAALRQYRMEQMRRRTQGDAGSAGQGTGNAGEEGRVRGRLRRVFGIRTRRTGAVGENEAAAVGTSGATEEAAPTTPRDTRREGSFAGAAGR